MDPDIYVPDSGDNLLSTRSNKEDWLMSLIYMQPVVALIAGILILVIPRLLNYIVAIYLIIVGILGLV